MVGASTEKMLAKQLQMDSLVHIDRMASYNVIFQTRRAQRATVNSVTNLLSLQVSNRSITGFAACCDANLLQERYIHCMKMGTTLQF